MLHSAYSGRWKLRPWFPLCNDGPVGGGVTFGLSHFLLGPGLFLERCGAARNRSGKACFWTPNESEALNMSAPYITWPRCDLLR